jgi:SET domain-containing protein
MGRRSKSKKIPKNRPSSRPRTQSLSGIKPRIDARYACFKLRVGRSSIHRRGVFADEPIPAHRKVIEYTGERISSREVLKRYANMTSAKSKYLTYLFELNRYWVIDGAAGGCGAELINHSCNPNLRQKICKGHILLMSGRRIKRGEELAYDYRFDRKAQRVPCACGSRNCRGTINANRKDDWIYWSGRRRS